jgi:hypothetical protein
LPPSDSDGSARPIGATGPFFFCSSGVRGGLVLDALLRDPGGSLNQSSPRRYDALRISFATTACIVVHAWQTLIDRGVAKEPAPPLLMSEQSGGARRAAARGRRNDQPYDSATHSIDSRSTSSR